MKVWSILFISLLAVIGVIGMIGATACTDDPDRVGSEDPIPEHMLPCGDCFYLVNIDEQYTSSQREAIQFALHDWKILIPKILFITQYVKLEKEYSTKPRIIHIHYGFNSSMDNNPTGWAFWQDNGGEIFINMIGKWEVFDPKTPWGNKFLEIVTEHEIGHVLGLPHNTEVSERPHDIMNPVTDINSVILQEDVDNVLKIHPECVHVANR